MKNYKTKSDEKEVFRLLANQVEKYKEEGCSCIAFTSHVREQGKSYIINELAATLAQVGNKVLVIDANIFKPTLTEVAGYKERGGVEDLLEKITSQQEAWTSRVEQDYVLELKGSRAYFLPKGNDSEKDSEKLIRGKAFKILLAYLKPKYDFILVELPSFEKLSYVQYLSEAVDGCLLVLKSGSLKIAESASVKEQLGTLGCKVLSCILNHKENISYSKEQIRKQKKAKKSASVVVPAGEQVTIS